MTQAGSSTELQARLEVLRGICHAFGSSRDVEEAATATVRWVRAGLGSETPSVHIALSDPDGGLRPVEVNGSKKAARAAGLRKRAFETKRPQWARDRSSASAVVAMPLMCRGQSIGVLEVTAPQEMLDGRWEELVAIASQAAIVFGNLHTVPDGGGNGTAPQPSEQLRMVLARTAHELVNPVVGAKAVIEHLLTTGAVGDQDRELLLTSQIQLEELTTLIYALLTWWRGNGWVDTKETDLVWLVKEAVEICSLEQGEERVSVSTPPSLVVDADPIQLRGAITNVVRNALAYSPRDTQVIVVLEPRSDFAELSVADKGPGIPEHERAAIFEPFFRGRSSNSPDTGAGLGLFVTRQVVESHEGKILLDSDEKGSTFRFQLPHRARKGEVIGNDPDHR